MRARRPPASRRGAARAPAARPLGALGAPRPRAARLAAGRARRRPGLDTPAYRRRVLARPRSARAARLRRRRHGAAADLDRPAQLPGRRRLRRTRTSARSRSCCASAASTWRIVAQRPAGAAVRRGGRAAARKRPRAFLFPDVHVTPEDQRDCARRAAAFAPAIPADAAAGGVPLAALAQELVEAERPGAGGRARARAARPGLRARRRAPRADRPHLRGPHRGSSCSPARRASICPRRTVIGYENLNMSRLSLSMFPAPASAACARCRTGSSPTGPRSATSSPPRACPRTATHRLRAPSRARSGRRPRARARPAGRCAARGDGDRARPLGRARREGGGRVRRRGGVRARRQGAPARSARRARPCGAGPHADELRFDERPTLELLREADVLLYTYTASRSRRSRSGCRRSSSAPRRRSTSTSSSSPPTCAGAPAPPASSAPRSRRSPRSTSRRRGPRARAAAERAIAPVGTGVRGGVPVSAIAALALDFDGVVVESVELQGPGLRRAVPRHAPRARRGGRRLPGRERRPLPLREVPAHLRADPRRCRSRRANRSGSTGA